MSPTDNQNDITVQDNGYRGVHIYIFTFVNVYICTMCVVFASAEQTTQPPNSVDA